MFKSTCKQTQNNMCITLNKHAVQLVLSARSKFGQILQDVQRGLADFNSSVMLLPIFLLSDYYACHNLVSCDLINLTMCPHKYFKIVDISILFHCSAGPEKPFLLYIFHHKDSATLLQCSSTKHPCEHSRTAYCIGFCFRCYCTCRT